jgi:methionine synthase II (cobalamin-independent)
MARKTVKITLYMSELIYDVENKTYLTGRSRDNGTNYAEVAHMQASDDEENGNQILRSIGNAFANLKTKLAEYIDDSETSTANNAQLSADSDLVLALSLPNNYNQATADNLGTALHQYIVNSAIGDWFTITNKADAADYIALAQANLDTAREAVSKRSRPSRPAISNETTTTIIGGTLKGVTFPSTTVNGWKDDIANAGSDSE